MPGAQELDEDAKHLALRIAWLRNEKKIIEDEEKALRAELLSIMELQNIDTGLNSQGEPLVVLTQQHRKTVDRAKLEALYPEVFDTVLKESVVITLKVNETGGL